MLLIKSKIQIFKIIIIFVLFLKPINSHADQFQFQYFNKVKACKWTLIKEQNLQVKEQAQIKEEEEEEEFFSSKTGECQMNFINNSTSSSHFSLPTKRKLIIAFFRPKYRDIRMVKMEIPLLSKNNQDIQDGLQQNITFTANNIEMDYSEMVQLQIIKKNTNHITYQISKQKTILRFNSLQVKIEFEAKKSSLVLPFSFILYNLVLLVLSQIVIRKKIIPQKISLLSLYHSVTFMLFLSVLELLVGIAELPSYHSWFIVSGILTVILAIRMIQAFQEAVQRMIGIKGYLIFYISLFSYLWLLLKFGNKNWLLIFNSLGLIPQIVHNVRYGNKLGLHFSYITILISNQAYVLYIKGYSENLLRYHPEENICKIIIILTMIQVIFITLQGILGPLFFIPKRFIPGYHNYFDVITIGTQIGQQQCPICLCALGENPQSISKNLISSNQQLKNPQESKKNKLKQSEPLKKVIMKTPCGHSFHRECLSDWMEYKRQCPVDRTQIPPIL